MSVKESQEVSVEEEDTLRGKLLRQVSSPQLQKELKKQFGQLRWLDNNNIKQWFKRDKKVGPQITRRAYAEGNIIKLGYLQKQGGQVKSWKNRFFVLRSKALFYFKTQSDFVNGRPPRGYLLLKDMMPGNKNFICEKIRLYAFIGKPQCFCVHSRERTLVMCTRSKEEKMVWMKTLQKAYNDLWKSYQLTPPLKNITDPETQKTYEDVEMVARDLEVIDMLEMAEVAERTRILYLQKTLAIWKYHHKLQKAEKSK